MHDDTPREQDNLKADTALDSAIEASTDPVVISLKNAHRLEKIRASLRAEAELLMQTSPMSRIMRRDWNIVSAKLFLNALDPAYSALIKKDLDELHWQVDDLAHQLKMLRLSTLDKTWMRPRQMVVQVIHPLTASWLRAFKRFDTSFCLLINAEKAGLITRRQRFAMLAPSQLTYFAFKARAMNLSVDNYSGQFESEQRCTETEEV